MALGGGCGEPVVGGSGRLVPGANGAPDLLILKGSPYEMGWWHGRILKDKIERLAKRWQRVGIAGEVGSAGDTTTGKAGDVRGSIDLYTDIALERLPETARQELDGLSDATGIEPAALLFTEVMRDGLRVYLDTIDPRLPGGLAAFEAGPEAQAWWGGADARVFAENALVIERNPDEGAASVALSWPGGLGGVAGVSAKRVAYLHVEASVDDEMRGFGKGVPFTIATRVAIESGKNADWMRANMGGTAGHAVLVMSDPDPDDDESRAVVGSVEVYRGIQPEIAVGELGYIVLGPDQDVRAGLAKAGLSERPENADGLDGRVRAAAKRFATGDGNEAPPTARIHWQPDGTIVFEARAADGRAVRRRVLKTDGTFGE
ncbi:MAG: hypothetical protein QNJ98_11030 [Planctomycetota bacterium]|nr:hypothetical protein [Planctomycetota bacterium]